MAELAHLAERRTSTDVVYEYLYQEIVTLKLLPGAKISETEIAKRFGMSRQPVRDAFSRLGNDDLLYVQPQKSTEVKRFSRKTITRARFVRAAIEIEVLRTAARNWDGHTDQAISANLDSQTKAAKAGQAEQFHELDAQFHQLMCEAAGLPHAHDAIRECKIPVDRLCVLSLSNEDKLNTLLEDHSQIFAAVQAHNVEKTESLIRHHLGRLDETIAHLYGAHRGYFSD